MPVCMNANHDNNTQLGPPKLCGNLPDRCLTIGLVNNMADAALEATERQFRTLLNAASEKIPVRLQFYSLPEIRRSDSAARRVQNFYKPVEELWDKRLDGLIVTGREPLTSNLRDEPYWKSFTAVLEWAKENTYSTIWSCLAAHAAVLHMDGIGRIRSEEKHFGIYECSAVASHRLMAHTPARFGIPHSRWNSISEDALRQSGYGLLTLTENAGVDTFIKPCKSLFVFFQGHPEYEVDTLLREYRRDIGRFLRREIERYPVMPRSYFDRHMTASLEAMRELAISRRSEEMLPQVSSSLDIASVHNTWHAPAVAIYRNWLEYIASQKRNALSLTRINFASESQAATNAVAV